MSIWSQIFNGTENSEFCQISVAGLKWSKIWFLSQIFNTAHNFWILPNFILHRWGGVKNLFSAKFSTRLIISGFCQISFFADSKWSKLSILSQIFKRDWKFLDFIKFHSSHVPSGQKLSQIFNMTQNFWILSNFILCRFWVVETLNFDQNFKWD